MLTIAGGIILGVIGIFILLKILPWAIYALAVLAYFPVLVIRSMLNGIKNPASIAKRLWKMHWMVRLIFLEAFCMGLILIYVYRY